MPSARVLLLVVLVAPAAAESRVAESRVAGSRVAGSRVAESRVAGSRLCRFAAVRGGADDVPTSASESSTPRAPACADGGLLSDALAMLADGTMLARLQLAARTDPAARARIAELLAIPAFARLVHAAGLAPAAGATVEEVLAAMAVPETVERMRALAGSPEVWRKVAAVRAGRRAGADGADDGGLADDGDALLRRLHAVRTREPARRLSDADALVLPRGARVLARHAVEGAWLTATVTGVAHALPGGGAACDVRYADGEEERAVPASRLAPIEPTAELPRHG